MRGSQVTVISENRHLVRSVTRALVSGGARVHTCGLAADQLESELRERRDLIVVDADHDTFGLSTAVHEIVLHGPDRKVLVLCRELSGPIADLILDGNLDHVIAKHGGVAIARDLIDETELLVTCGKLISGDIFGLERYLPLPEIDIREHPIDHSGKRPEVIDCLDSFLEAIDCYRSLRAVILTVADELLMNAIFSAPRDERGGAKYALRDRSARFQLEPNELVTFRYGCDGRNVVLSVADRFGALDRRLLLEYLGAGLRHQKGRVSTTSISSAGLGLHLVINSITQLVFNVEVGKRTEAIAGFFVRNGIRGFRASGQSLNLFIENGRSDHEKRVSPLGDRATDQPLGPRV